MASITERDGRFLVRVRRHGFPLAAKTFTRKGDGIAWARRVEADMESGRWERASRRVPTLKAAIAEYRIKVASRMKGAATYAYRFDELEAATFAGKPLNDVSPFDLATWRDAQMEGRKPGTVVRKMAILSSVFTWAMKERGWVTENPFSKVSRPRVADGRARTLTPKEFDYLIAAARSSKAAWLPDVLMVLVRSAMRRGELFALRRSDIDYSASVAHLSDTKNGERRGVPLCPEALEALRALDSRAASRGAESLVPLTAVGSISTRFAQTVIRGRRQYLLDCAERQRVATDGFLVDVRLHDLRHCAISSWAATSALSLPELMAISGHKTPRMMTRYAHISSSALAAKLATLRTALPSVSTVD